MKKRGRLIIPSFSVGRTQEIVYILSQLEATGHLPPVDFYLDSPLSFEATEVTKKHSECFNKKLTDYMRTHPDPFSLKRLTYITKAEDSIKLNEHKEPCVIISASGMADAGRVKHHIKWAIGDSRNTILIAGYCEPNSLGGKLMAGEKEVTIFSEPYEVKAEVKVIRSLSAHGDYDDLLRFTSCQNPQQLKKLFIVHGEYDVQQIFKTKLEQKGYQNVEIPSLHQQFLI